MCDKVRFRNPRHAADSLSIIRQASSRSRIPRRAYYCRHCKGYHLAAEPDEVYRQRVDWQRQTDQRKPRRFPKK